MRQPALFLVSALCSQMLLAEPAMQASASIQQSAQGYQGNLMLNQAAGDAQQQANARAIAIGRQAGAETQVRQYNQQNADPAAIDATAHIGGSSFAGNQGVTGVNQGAGSGNQQINALRIAVGLPQGLDDSALAQQSVAPSGLSGAAEPQSGQRVVSIDDAAFGNSRGVVQLNQSAGVGNRSINSLGIRVTE
jgi:hypothetical protein